MKTKTRKVIGNVLVWGGLIVLTITNTLIFNRYGFHYDSVSPFLDTLHFLGYLNYISIASILFGGLWGMRR